VNANVDVHQLISGDSYLNVFQSRALYGGVGVWGCANKSTGPVVLVQLENHNAFIAFIVFENEACLTEWLAENPETTILWRRGGKPAQEAPDDLA
jgi:hypothetical protein